MKNENKLTSLGKNFFSKKDLHKAPFVTTMFCLEDETNKTPSKKEVKKQKNAK